MNASDNTKKQDFNIKKQAAGIKTEEIQQMSNSDLIRFVIRKMVREFPYHYLYLLIRAGGMLMLFALVIAALNPDLSVLSTLGRGCLIIPLINIGITILVEAVTVVTFLINVMTVKKSSAEHSKS